MNYTKQHIEVYIRFKTRDNEISTLWLTLPRLDSIAANVENIKKHCPEYVLANMIKCSYVGV